MLKNKILFLILLAGFLVGCSIHRISPEEIQNTINKVQKSKLIILDVYSDSCPSCRRIKPVMKELEINYEENPDITFLKFDYSNPFTMYDSEKLANKLGLENIFRSQRYVGVVHLVDVRTKKILDSLIGEYNFSRYTEIIEKRLTEHAT